MNSSRIGAGLAAALLGLAAQSALAAPLSASGFTTGYTLPTALIRLVEASVQADQTRLTNIYQDLHQHPEIAYTEYRTAAIVSQDLKRLGFEVTEGIAKTGVVGVLRNGEGPTVWFRADMDANSVKERTGLPYAATEKQRLADGREIDVMHACGHDAHVTWLLGMAQSMVALKEQWSGTLVVYAQPAEEVGTGAQSMVADGLWLRGFPQPDYAFGVHTAPIPVGIVVSAPGVRMAGVDQLDVTFFGEGGHGSMPEMTVDPVVMAAQAVLSYQTIISRNLDPQTPAVLTVGAIEAGQDNNVIPESALLKLNLRWFNHAVRDQLLTRIDEVNRGIAIAAGVVLEKMPTRLMKGNASALVNDDALITHVNSSLVSLLGQEQVMTQVPAVMGSEDFQEAFHDMQVPYAYLHVGVAPAELYAQALAEGKSFPYSNHNPDFFVDLAAIPVGAKVNTVMALSVLAKP